jgi:hypothetical protein
LYSSDEVRMDVQLCPKAHECGHSRPWGSSRSILRV